MKNILLDIITVLGFSAICLMLAFMLRKLSDYLVIKSKSAKSEQERNRAIKLSNTCKYLSDVSYNLSAHVEQYEAGGAAKKEKALNSLVDIANQHGITITNNEASGLIENAVTLLKNNGGEIHHNEIKATKDVKISAQRSYENG
ncbi:phage holin, LLH family [Apilactobacillus xinyiensis]|uniref:phage holin, LLH family n=1 Tax=Apilactobacillus xinyiensis TaxID=2841032 RepID=UPI00200C7001|nr:phage holin, LLH family [Apilactobacillus xinyiensis]MCL0319397.1 phage holin family protein [Apilactobacillus xinyiensis]